MVNHYLLTGSNLLLDYGMTEEPPAKKLSADQAEALRRRREDCLSFVPLGKILMKLTAEYQPELSRINPKAAKEVGSLPFKTRLVLDPCPKWARQAVWRMADEGLIDGYPDEGFNSPQVQKAAR